MLVPCADKLFVLAIHERAEAGNVPSGASGQGTPIIAFDIYVNGHLMEYAFVALAPFGQVFEHEQARVEP